MCVNKERKEEEKGREREAEGSDRREIDTRVGRRGRRRDRKGPDEMVKE